MSKLNLENIDTGRIDEIQKSVESNSSIIINIVNQIIEPYCKDLDDYVEFISSILGDGENPPTNEELDDFCLNLSTLIYIAGSMCEQLGIRDDISKAVYKETYHKARASLESGTVADKDSLAELYSQQEQITNVCYNRAYKIMRSKIENAQELLSSCKKVLSRRMSEFELTHMQR